MNNKDINLYNGHKLIYKGGDAWEFSKAEDWMPLQLTYGDQNQIIALDAPDMMMPLMVGNSVYMYEIKSICEIDERFYVFMKKRYKNYISELERGDLLYVVTPNKYGVEINRYVFDCIADRQDSAADNFFAIYVYSEDDATKTKKYIMFGKNRLDEDMNSKEGLKVGVTHETSKLLYQKVFTNVDHAKAYGYDLCQDIIEQVKKNQREIMNKY